jgi:hypothetical protein
MRRLKAGVLLLLPLALLFLPACHKPEPTAEAPTPSEQQKRAARTKEVSESTQRQWTYLNRIRQADTFDAIDRTMVNEQNQLGVVLSPNLTPDKVPALMEKVMQEMARGFPGEDMTLSAYTPSRPPRKLGTVHLDGQSGKATYAPAK